MKTLNHETYNYVSSYECYASDSFDVSDLVVKLELKFC